jgi:hypothetical protein
MLRDFDIFEKFPDGTTAWRTFVSGQFEAERKLQELAEHSRNEFVLIDIQSGKPLPMIAPRKSQSAIDKVANL